MTSESRRERLRLGPVVLAGCLGSLTVAAAVVLTLPRLAPESAAASWVATRLPAPTVWAQRSDAALRAGHLSDALTHARREVQAAPARSDAWLRLARARALTGDRAGAVVALDETYKLAAVDERLARWRLPLATTLWPELGPSTRATAVAEYRALWARRDLRPWLANLAASAPGPAGRFALSLTLEELKSRPRR